jgi:hypothetical protein
MKEQMVQEPLAGLAELEARAESLPPQSEREDIMPVAVGLGERAMALEAIMVYYNQANKVNGMAQVVGNHQSGFYRRYGKQSGEVYQAAVEERNRLHQGFQESIAVLAATDVLRSHGEDEADVDITYRTVQAELNKKFGVGSTAKSRDRKKVVKDARRSLPTTE